MPMYLAATDNWNIKVPENSDCDMMLLDILISLAV